MAKRSVVEYVTTLANANEQKFTLNTDDNYRPQHVKSVFVGLATAGIALKLYVSGQWMSSSDLSRFAAGDSRLHVEFDVPAQIALVVSLTNPAAGALINVPIQVEYEVDGP